MYLEASILQIRLRYIERERFIPYGITAILRFSQTALLLFHTLSIHYQMDLRNQTGYSLLRLHLSAQQQNIHNIWHLTQKYSSKICFNYELICLLR